MSNPTTHIEVQPEHDGGWSVARNRIIDGYFNSLQAANDYASACAQRAKRAGLDVRLLIWPDEPPSDAAA
ncbi:hypothetical protein E2F46_08755 [Luteimonas aestuarii]|uniref:DUF2188 domain-containing protein n=1 Tax=Luteimonas aestuarii TaxID=453837 RepID=A0A4R5TTM7_9GAMM|nr:hypothetical protein [Luteimonas aestuarii]TDK24363.1 hypothetical protein E2F46_08755 [Luteimonas aestuarii]